MKRRRLLTIVAALVGSSAVLRSGQSGAAVAAGDATVTIDNFSFKPAVLTIAAGTRVTWLNRDDTPHTIVDRDDPKAMKSPGLDTDDSFSFTYAKSGTFQYFCSLHPHMVGSVVVK